MRSSIGVGVDRRRFDAITFVAPLSLRPIRMTRAAANIQREILLFFMHRRQSNPKPSPINKTKPINTKKKITFKNFFQTLMASPSSAATKATAAEARERAVLARAALLRGNGEWISAAGLAQRKAYLAAKVRLKGKKENE